MSDQNHDNDGRYDKIDATETSNSKVDNTDRDKDDNKSNKDRDESIDDRRRGREKESRDSRRKDREDSRDGRRRGRDDESRDSRRVDVSRDDRRRGRDDSRDRRDRSRRDRSLSRDKGRRSRDDSRDRRRRSPSPVSRRGSSRRSRSADRKSRRSRTRSRSIPKVEEPAKTIVPLKSNKFWDGFQWVDRTPLTAAIAPNAKSESDEAAAAALISSSIGQKDRRIYVGNLPAGVSHEMIKEFINNSLLACNFLPPSGVSSTVLSVWISSDARYAFVELCSAEAATVALALTGINFLGMTLKISRPKTYTGSGSERMMPGYM